MPTRTGLPGKYDALLHHLQALPAEVHTVTLTLDALEALLGFPPPASAWNSNYWGKRVNGRATAWGQAGFTARLLHYPGAPSVEFQRVTGQQG